MIAGSFISLGIVYFVPDLLHVISNEEFWSAATIVPLLMLANLLKLLNYPFQTGILVEKKTRYIFYTGLVTTVTSVITNVVLIYHFGVLGACVSQIIVSMVLITMTNVISQRFYSVHYEYRKIAVLIALTIVFYFASYTIGNVLLFESITLKTVLIILYLIAMLYIGILEKGEKAHVMSWVQNRLIKRTNSP